MRYLLSLVFAALAAVVVALGILPAIWFVMPETGMDPAELGLGFFAQQMAPYGAWASFGAFLGGFALLGFLLNYILQRVLKRVSFFNLFRGFLAGILGLGIGLLIIAWGFGTINDDSGEFAQTDRRRIYWFEALYYYAYDALGRQTLGYILYALGGFICFGALTMIASGRDDEEEEAEAAL